jgi:hypothetical protein
MNVNAMIINDDSGTLTVAQRRDSGGLYLSQGKLRVALTEAEVAKLVAFISTGTATPPKARLISYPAAHADTE